MSDFEMRDLVAGEVMEKSTMDWLRSIRVLIEEEQRKIAPDTHLISVLCDTVRYHREMMERFRVEQGLLRGIYKQKQFPEVKRWTT